MDAEISVVRMAQRGDLPAFTSLVEGHWTRLVGLARSILGDADAEDAVQDGMVAVWQNLHRLKDPAAFTSWVMRIVSRACLRRVRSRKPLVPLAAVPEPSDRRSATGVGNFDVERVLAVLAPRQRAVMHLTVIEGMTDSEIGQALGINAASVRSHRRRARNRLRQVLVPAAAAEHQLVASSWARGR